MAKLNETYKTASEMHIALDGLLGRRGINNKELTSRPEFTGVPYNADGLLYTNFKSTLMDKLMTWVRDPENKNKTLAEIYYRENSDGSVTVFQQTY